MKRFIYTVDDIDTTSFLYSYHDFLKYFRDLLESEQEIVSNQSDHVEKVMVTSNFDRGVKALKKRHKQQELDKLKEIIDKLLRYQITSQYRNHPLVNSKAGLNDIHVSGDIILLYKYSTDSEMLTISLKLADLSNHRDLQRKANKKYAYTREYEVGDDFDSKEILD